MIKRDMIIAFAGLEGIELLQHRNVQLYKTSKGDISVNGVSYGVYDPILDLSLNCAARDKYEINIDWYEETASIISDYTNLPNEFVSGFSLDGCVPRAVIVCILKSKGLWKC